ncbi:hypothetical protein [Nocardia xishanensis]
MGTVESLSPSKLSTARSATCLLALIAEVSVRFSRLPIRESLAPHTAATIGTALLAATAVFLSVMLAIRSGVGRQVSVILAILAAVSCLLQVAKLYFAAVGHHDLVFEDHVLVAPRGSLTYFNVPLVLIYTADIVLWFVSLPLSMACTSAYRRRTADRHIN